MITRITYSLFREILARGLQKKYVINHTNSPGIKVKKGQILAKQIHRITMIVLLFGITLIYADGFQVTQQVAIHGGSGLMINAAPEAAVSSAMVTFGQSLAGSASPTDGSDGMTTDLGIWSLYLKQPDEAF